MFYELLKKVTEHHKAGLPFVIYRKPKESLVQAILQEDVQIHYTKDFSESGFVFAPFDSDQPAVLMLSKTKLSEYFESNPDSETVVDIDFLTDYKQEEFHLELVKKGISQIDKNSFRKVVLSRKIIEDCKSDSLDLFHNLLKTYSNAFCYLWFHPKVGTWLGATPEILLKIENQHLTTMSLAGTQKYVLGEEPHWGNKEVEEQQLVTDYISNSLKDKIAGLQISDRESIQAGSLWHLRTKLTGRIEKDSLHTCIKALHPTPAVCGLPMSATKTFILENENYNREFYTGFLGELNLKEERDRYSSSRNQENKAYRSIKNTTTLFVNLRCMQLKNSQAEIYVGGGITHDSDAEKEWHETVAKSKNTNTHF